MSRYNDKREGLRSAARSTEIPVGLRIFDGP